MSEFTKECRELIKTEGDDKGWEWESGYIIWLETKLGYACSTIENLESHEGKLKAEITRWRNCNGSYDLIRLHEDLSDEQALKIDNELNKE